MKIFKIFLSFLPIYILVVFSYIKSRPSPIDNPNSSVNYITSELNQAFQLSNLNVSIENISVAKQEIEIKTNNTIAYLPLYSDPYFQISILQNILKNANIKSKHVEFIDLNAPYPYATLKNN